MGGSRPATQLSAVNLEKTDLALDTDPKLVSDKSQGTPQRSPVIPTTVMVDKCEKKYHFESSRQAVRAAIQE